MTNDQRPRGWRAAEDLCGRIASPKTDLAESDRVVEAMLRGSWLWSLGESFVVKVRAAWLESRCRRLVRTCVRE